jgi:hypothetical protein
MFCNYLSRGSAVGIETAYGLDDRGKGVRAHVGSEFFLLRIVQTGSEAYPASYPVVPGVISPGSKRQGREADHLLPASA